MPPESLVESFQPINPTSILVVGAVLPGLATIFVALRLWCRFAKKNDLGLDDWTILFATVMPHFRLFCPLPNKGNSFYVWAWEWH
jgi:hypothetical protein